MFQSKPGPALLANYAVPAAVVAQSLGRLPSRNVTNVTVNLIEPGSMYGDRRNELDLRVAKILRFGRTRTTVGADIYNLLNTKIDLPRTGRKHRPRLHQVDTHGSIGTTREIPAPTKAQSARWCSRDPTNSSP